MINQRVLTYHEKFVFNDKTHNLQTQKFEVIMTSSMAKKTLNFYWWNMCFLLNIPWAFCGILNIFHGNTKKRERVFFSEHSVVQSLNLKTLAPPLTKLIGPEIIVVYGTVKNCAAIPQCLFRRPEHNLSKIQKSWLIKSNGSNSSNSTFSFHLISRTISPKSHMTD